MQDNWRDEVKARLEKDATYRQWERSSKRMERILKDSMTERQVELFIDYATTVTFMRMFGQDYAYELGKEHGRAEAKKKD